MFLRVKLFWASLGLLGFLFSISSSDAKEGDAIAKRRPNRVIASDTSSKVRVPASQGNLMLKNLRSSNPEFLRPPGAPKNTGAQLQFNGLCRNGYGQFFLNTDRDYGRCMDARPAGTNDYFGGAQRQAGVGLLVR